jgi:hypothetical protein
VSRKVARYKLDLVGVEEEVRWEIGSTGRAGNCIFLWKRKRKSLIGNRGFLYTTEYYQQLRELIL